MDVGLLLRGGNAWWDEEDAGAATAAPTPVVLTLLGTDKGTRQAYGQKT